MVVVDGTGMLPSTPQKQMQSNRFNRSFRQLTARISTEQWTVNICMFSDSIRVVRSEMDGRIDRSAPLCRKMLGSIPISEWWTRAKNESWAIKSFSLPRLASPNRKIRQTRNCRCCRVFFMVSWSPFPLPDKTFLVTLPNARTHLYIYIHSYIYLHLSSSSNNQLERERFVEIWREQSRGRESFFNTFVLPPLLPPSRTSNHLST